MYLTIGETKLLVGQYGDNSVEKLELNFEYLFDSYRSYRRFAQVIADVQSSTIKIKVKSEFKIVADCSKLSKLLIGVQNLITPDNLNLLSSILDSKSEITPQDFIDKQANLIKYFS